MDTAEAQRLLEEQIAAIQQTEQRTEQLTRYKEDYEALHKRLETLPDKITHDVMVPFGKLAFMPGKLVHTNEITVLLGDNWFVDRSAKQACDIIDRRVDVINKQLSELEQQKGLLEPRRQFTEDLWEVGREREGAFEIREEFDEQKEQEWKEKHRENMKKYRREQKAEEERQAAVAAATPAKEPLTDIELWARLDELEDKERKDREMDKLDEEIASEETADRTREGGRGAEDIPEEDEDDYDDDDDESEEDEDSDDYEEEEEEQAAPPRPVSIRFSHTQSDNTQPSLSKPTLSAEGTPVITSPSDIYTHYMGAPRSILKSPGSPGTNGKHRVTITEPERTAGAQGEGSRREDAPPKPQPLSVTPKAFTGAIVERQDTTQVTAPGPPEPAAPQPRMSKFKAQRMKQQNR